MMTLDLSGLRFSVTYAVAGDAREARAAADLLAIDQSVEAPDEIVPPAIARALIGRVERVERAEQGYHATISFAAELLGEGASGLLLAVFGISSLRDRIRVVAVDIPQEALAQWPGPRLGRDGLRARLGVYGRPLVCAVLKPVGQSPAALADLASQFARAGVDLIKDDQALGDHHFCRFDERLHRCADAVRDASAKTGRPCLYLPHISAPWEAMRARAAAAHRAGAGGVLVCPGLTGFDALVTLARDPTLDLPIMSHPAFLGTFYVTPSAGIAPAVLFGRLPRLMGADITIYPAYGAGFPMTRTDCAAIAEACGAAWGPIKSAFPTAAGRMGVERVEELSQLYGTEVVFILGSRVQADPSGMIAGCRRFMERIGVGRGVA